MRFTYCPGCHKKGVYLCLAEDGEEDCLKCRYCEWSVFTAITWNVSDVPEQERWRQENAQRGEDTQSVLITYLESGADQGRWCPHGYQLGQLCTKCHKRVTHSETIAQGRS